MSLTNDDINDFEIRVISSDNNDCDTPTCIDNCRNSIIIHDSGDEIENDIMMIMPSWSQSGDGNEQLDLPQPKKHHKGLWLIISLAIVIVLVILGLIIGHKSMSKPDIKPAEQETVAAPTIEGLAIVSQQNSSVLVIDTIINHKGLTIFEPRNATASLALGDAMLADSTIILANQAADIRGDNGEIVGTFVLNGELKSRGESKAGFCAIINGQPTIGVADATPLLEQALTEGGDFFRQYPLVVGGQTIENKPKGRAIRKALAEIGTRVCIIVSHEKLTLGEFSDLLTEAGVRNAIYLCGGESFGFYTDEEGLRKRIDNEDSAISDNVSFIIWR